MEQLDSSPRWNQVMTMVNYMLSGNFSHQIPQLPSSKEGDQLELLIIRLNLLAQQLESFFKRVAYLKENKTFMFLAGVAFVLTKGFKILNASKAVLGMFKFKRKELIGKDFSELLYPSKDEEWKLLQKELPDPNFPHFNLRLYFKTKDGLSIKADCSVSEMIVDGHAAYIVSFFETAVLEDKFIKIKPEIWQKIVNKDGMSDQQDPDERLSPRELMIVRELHNLILSNLHGPKPDFKEFALDNGLTEAKLGKIFKMAYQATPSKYYLAERFHRIKTLVITTDMPLIEIAASFDLDYPYFSNTFKRLFGRYPRELRKTRKKYK